jgi:hypothetical protein
MPPADQFGRIVATGRLGLPDLDLVVGGLAGGQ